MRSIVECVVKKKNKKRTKRSHKPYSTPYTRVCSSTRVLVYYSSRLVVFRVRTGVSVILWLASLANLMACLIDLTCLGVD